MRQDIVYQQPILPPHLEGMILTSPFFVSFCLRKSGSRESIFPKSDSFISNKWIDERFWQHPDSWLATMWEGGHVGGMLVVNTVEFFLEQFTENRVEFPEERNAFFLTTNTPPTWLLWRHVQTSNKENSKFSRKMALCIPQDNAWQFKPPTFWANKVHPYHSYLTKNAFHIGNADLKWNAPM